MDFNDLKMFAAAKSRISWLTQRQEVLAQNIANADTPRYRAKDLKPYEFKEIMRRENSQLNMNVTSGDHLPGRRRRIRDFAEEQVRSPYETAPNGNSVVLEEQMSKVNETHTKHALVTSLYKKHLTMMVMAVRGNR